MEYFEVFCDKKQNAANNFQLEDWGYYECHPTKVY